MLDRAVPSSNQQQLGDCGFHHVLRRDAECYSPVPLKAGVSKYALQASIKCYAYAIDDGEVRLWQPGDPVPPEVVEAARNPEWCVEAHNDPFESALERYQLAPKFGFPVVPMARHFCTQAQALALALPGGLDPLAEIFGLPQKDPVGHRIMLKMARGEELTADEDLQLFAYCKRDVEIQRALSKLLPRLSPAEHELRLLDQKINAVGVYIDQAQAEAMQQIAQQAFSEIYLELAHLTGGQITTIGQTKAMQGWLAARGINVTSLAKGPLEKLVARPDLPDVARRLLQLRRDGAMSSLAKIGRVIADRHADGRLRDLFQYHGGATGRWAGRGANIQNLPKPQPSDLRERGHSEPPAEVTDAAIGSAVELIRTGNLAAMQARFANPLAVLRTCSRSVICAAPDHVLLVGDFSGIEARLVAWAAGEEWKLDAFRKGIDVYRVTGAQIFNVPFEEVTKQSPARAVGKVCELAFSYMGSVGAFRRFAPRSMNASDKQVYEFRNKWRRSNSKIVALWYALEHAARRALSKPDHEFVVGCCVFVRRGSDLKLLLPSKRELTFPRACIVWDRNEFSYIAFRDNAKGFSEARAYGGLFTNNLIQGIARDLLASALLRLDAANFCVVAHIHDEIVIEEPEGSERIAEFKRLMVELPEWADGLPMAAETYVAKRYKK